MSYSDIEMPDSAIVERLAGVLREVRDLADLIVVRPHLNGAAGPWIQQVILGAVNAHQAAEGAAIKSDAPLIHRARVLGDYIWTYGGGRFFPQDPKAAEVNVHAIAHSLSHKARWTAHADRFYSVGEHSLHVAEIAASLALHIPGVSPWTAAVYALVHDAGREAYLPDVARPIANYLDASLSSMAEACQEAVYQALDILPPTATVEELVSTADAYALRLEAETLFPHEDHDPDAVDCNLRGIVVPSDVRDRFPVWSGEAPTRESVRDQWERALDRAIESMRNEPRPDGVDDWRDASKRIETSEECRVCAVDGRTALAVENGLCRRCSDG